MKKPKMMIFDYGHTLCYEPEQNYERGWRAGSTPCAIPAA